MSTIFWHAVTGDALLSPHFFLFCARSLLIELVSLLLFELIVGEAAFFADPFAPQLSRSFFLQAARTCRQHAVRRFDGVAGEPMMSDREDLKQYPTSLAV